VPESTVPEVTGGVIMVLALGYEEVTEDPLTTSGFVVVQLKVVVQLLAPEAIVQLGAVRVPDIVAAAATVIFVQGLQLLSSLLSVMTPPPALEVLSAQILIDLCPAPLKA